MGEKKLLKPYYYCFQIKILSKDILNGTKAKIDVKAVRDFQSRSKDDYFREGAMGEAIDIMKFQHTHFALYVPAERLNNVFNLHIALVYPNSTSTEIESALVSLRVSDLI